MRGHFNGHLGVREEGYDRTHRGFRFGKINNGEIAILDFAVAFELMIAKSHFKKKEEHLVTFKSGNTKTIFYSVDYVLLRLSEKAMCKD